MKDGVKSTGAVALAGGGIASAFCVAACCFIPILLAGVGIGTAWLEPIVSVSQPRAGLLSAFSGAALAASLALVWRAPRHCQPGSLGARPWFRWAVTGAAIIGFVLLILGHLYA